MKFSDLADIFRSNLPEGVHRKVDETLVTLEETYELSGDKGIYLILQPLEKLVSKLDNNMLKPIPAMRKLRNLEKWAVLLKEGIQKEDISLEDITDPGVVDDLWFNFMARTSSGRTVKICDLLEKRRDPEKAEPSKQYKDITSANLIVALGEILDDIENTFEEDMPGSRDLLLTGKYDEIDPSVYDVGSDWANRQIESGKTTRINIRNLILEKREDFKRSLELYKIFKPIYREVHTIITLMPILLTMMTENKPTMEGIRKDCNNIFMELSIGHQLERITLSLKEKVGKKRDVEDLLINAQAIEKTLKQIEDALNFRVFSSLRRLNVKTIIEEEIFEDAKKIGLDLTGLNSKFGIMRAPKEYKDRIMETTQQFSYSVIEYRKLIAPRLPEEFVNDVKTNLRTITKYIQDIEIEIGKYYMMIPPHIGPIYSSTVRRCTTDLDKITEFLAPLKKKILRQVITDDESKAVFYAQLDSLKTNLEASYSDFKQFFELGLILASVDQQLAVNFCKKATDEDLYAEAYDQLIQDSKKSVKRMLAMKTLSKDLARQIMKKIDIASQKLKSFTEEWSLQKIRDVLNN